MQPESTGAEDWLQHKKEQAGEDQRKANSQGTGSASGPGRKARKQEGRGWEKKAARLLKGTYPVMGNGKSQLSEFVRALQSNRNNEVAHAKGIDVRWIEAPKIEDNSEA